MKRVDEILKSTESSVQAPVNTDIAFLDEALGGLYPGEMTMICGDADSGKTALMIRLIHRMAFEENMPVLVLLNGMSEHTFLACMTAYYCNIKTTDVHQVFVNPICSKDDVVAYWELLSEKPVFFSDFQKLSPKPMDILKDDILGHGIKAVFVEQATYFVMKLLDETSASFLLKKLAKETQTVVIAEYEWGDDQRHPLTLLGFPRDGFTSNSDNVISMLDYENYGFFYNEKGEDLHGCIEMRIMKHKGVASTGKEIVMQKDSLYYRCPELAPLSETKTSADSNPAIRRLKDSFDCEIVSPF